MKISTTTLPYVKTTMIPAIALSVILVFTFMTEGTINLAGNWKKSGKRNNKPMLKVNMNNPRKIIRSLSMNFVLADKTPKYKPPVDALCARVAAWIVLERKFAEGAEASQMED